MVKRFVDNNRSFYAYAHNHKVWVNCPKCGELAFVWQARNDKGYDTHCVCTKCTFRVHETVKYDFVHQQNYWNFHQNLQGYFGKVRVTIDEKCPCKEGKFRFEKQYANKLQMPNVITLNCSYCQQTKDFHLKNLVVIQKVCCKKQAEKFDIVRYANTTTNQMPSLSK